METNMRCPYPTNQELEAIESADHRAVACLSLSRPETLRKWPTPGADASRENNSPSSLGLEGIGAGAEDFVEQLLC
jgi:hypothetical protein